MDPAAWPLGKEGVLTGTRCAWTEALDPVFLGANQGPADERHCQDGNCPAPVPGEQQPDADNEADRDHEPPFAEQRKSASDASEQRVVAGVERPQDDLIQRARAERQHLEPDRREHGGRDSYSK
jgi:hypothetical protein